MTGNMRVPDGWQVVRLGDVVELNRSNWDPASGESILYLDLTSVVEPGQLTSPREIAADDAPSRARRRVCSGDILVSTVRPYLRGFARVRQAPSNLVASTGFAVLTPQSGVDRSFVYHHVMAPQFTSTLESSMTGQAYPAVRPEDVTAYRLLLPPPQEQRAIAAVLDAIDEAIERTEAVIAATERLRESLLHELLTRGVPGWHTEWKDAPGIGTIPADWEVVRLGDVCDPPQYGAVAPARPLDPELPRYVRITDLTDNGRLQTEDARSAEPSQVKGYELEPGDLLFARSGATVGKTYLYRPQDGPCVYAGYLIRFRPVHSIALPRFVGLWTHSDAYRRWVASMFRAGAQPNINAMEYSSMHIPLPPLHEQRTIAAVLDGADEVIERARKAGNGSRSLKASAADALLTGRVRVSDNAMAISPAAYRQPLPSEPGSEGP